MNLSKLKSVGRDLVLHVYCNVSVGKLWLVCDERILFINRIYLYKLFIIWADVSVQYSNLLILIKSLAHYYLHLSLV